MNYISILEELHRDKLLSDFMKSVFPVIAFETEDGKFEIKDSQFGLIFGDKSIFSKVEIEQFKLKYGTNKFVLITKEDGISDPMD